MKTCTESIAQLARNPTFFETRRTPLRRDIVLVVVVVDITTAPMPSSVPVVDLSWDTVRHRAIGDSTIRCPVQRCFWYRFPLFTVLALAILQGAIGGNRWYRFDLCESFQWRGDQERLAPHLQFSFSVVGYPLQLGNERLAPESTETEGHVSGRKSR
jgi:hypothetical protein